MIRKVYGCGHYIFTNDESAELTSSYTRESCVACQVKAFEVEVRDALVIALELPVATQEVMQNV